MTVKEAIDHFDAIMNQPYERDLLIQWLSDLDGQAIREIFCYYDGSPAPDDWQPYIDSYDLNAVLLIPAPYEGVYMDYLRMKCDYWNKENSYTNTVKAFNNSYATFCDFWRRNHRRKQTKLKL